MRYAGLTVLLIVLAILAVVVVWRFKNVKATKPSDPFRMTIDDVFALKIPGTVVVVGVISEGEVKPGDTLYVETDSGQFPVTVEGLEAYHKPLRSANSGNRVGIMLKGLNKEQISPNDLLLGAGKGIGEDY